MRNPPFQAPAGPADPPDAFVAGAAEANLRGVSR
jgi:hypothetical protein